MKILFMYSIIIPYEMEICVFSEYLWYVILVNVEDSNVFLLVKARPLHILRGSVCALIPPQFKNIEFGPDLRNVVNIAFPWILFWSFYIQYCRGKSVVSRLRIS